MRGLSDKQEKFVRLVIQLGNQRAAYKQAYPNTRMTDAQIDSEASAMLNATGKYAKRPKVAQRYQALLAEVRAKRDFDAERAIISRVERLEILSKIAKRGEDQDAIKAIDVMNKMDGEYTNRVEVSGTLAAQDVLADTLQQLGMTDES